MDCPVCKNAMITLELEDVEIDHCTDCGGIWLDAGELELLLGDQGRANQLINSFNIDAKSKEKARKCPICFKKMKKIIAGLGEPKLLIDKCVKSHGLWFDRGELADILKSVCFDEENKVVKILADMFGQ